MKPRILALAAIVAVVVLVIGMGAKRGAGRGPKGPGQPGGPGAAAPAAEVVVPVQVATVRRGVMLRTLDVTGSLKTDRDIRVTSKIAARVAAVEVKEGDRVKAGQLLIRLDEADLKAQLDQMQAQLKSAEERLAQAKAGESTRYTQADAQIEQAQANLQAAKVRVQQLETAARVSDASLKSAVARAQSNLQSSKDHLSVVREGARKQERQVAQNAVTQAKVSLDTARTKAERRRKLYEEGAISREDLDENEKVLALAQSQYDSAVAQRNLVEEGARTEEVRIAEEQVRQADEALAEAKTNLDRSKMSADDISAARQQVAQAQAALDVARAGKSQYKIVPHEIEAAQAAVDEARGKVRFAVEQIRYVYITSPVDGVVSTCSVHEGEVVGTANVLMDIVALNGVYFEAQVPELSMDEVRVGMPVGVRVDSLGDKKMPGVVREIIPVAAVEGKSFRVRVAVNPPAGVQLPVGAFARGQVQVGRDNQVLLIPKDCLISLAGESYVYRVPNGRVQRVPVQIGDTDAENAQVVKGLQEGERVVSSGTAALTDGAKVKIVETPSGSGPGVNE